MKIRLNKPFFPNRFYSSLNNLLEDGFLTEGKLTKKFEERLKDLLKVKYVICVTSATVGIDLAIKSLMLNKKDEVIAPNFTYPATINPLILNKIKLKVIDCEYDSMNICFKSLEENLNNDTKVVLPVSTFGNPIDYDKLNFFKRKFKFKVLEDAAGALGSEFNNVKTGSHADITVFSFHPRKSITTGEGGAIATNDKRIYEWLKRMKNFGIVYNKDKVNFEHVGLNYKFPDLLSYFGLLQLDLFEKFQKKKNDIASFYIDQLKNSNLTFQKITNKGKHSFQSFCVLLKNRDKILNKMKEKGIEVQIGYYALSKLHCYKNENVKFTKNLEQSELAAKDSLCLPLYFTLKKKEQEYVIKNLKNLLNKEN